VEVCQLDFKNNGIVKLFLHSPPYRGVTKLDGTRCKKFGAPMFETEVFRKQMNYIGKSTCDIVGTFPRPPQSFSASIVIRGPENRVPPAPVRNLGIDSEGSVKIC